VPVRVLLFSQRDDLGCALDFQTDYRGNGIRRDCGNLHGHVNAGAGEF